jgi:hypothetical protein
LLWKSHILQIRLSMKPALIYFIMVWVIWYFICGSWDTRVKKKFIFFAFFIFWRIYIFGMLLIISEKDFTEFELKIWLKTCLLNACMGVAKLTDIIIYNFL